MRSRQILIITVLIIMMAGLFAYMYVFNIYEVEISVTPKELFADNHSTVVIRAVPLNSFGKKILFRKASAEFEIKEGKELVTIEKLNTAGGILVLKAKDKTGNVSIIVRPEKSILPSLVQISIRPNYAAVNKFNSE